MMCLTRVEKKKLLGRHNKVAKWLETAEQPLLKYVHETEKN